MLQQEMDANFASLNQLYWEGADKNQITWTREGDEAVATFCTAEDAALFVFGFLDRRIGKIKIVNTDEEDESLTSRVVFPEHKTSQEPITIKIPLEILNPPGLRAVLESQSHRGLARSLAIPSPPGL